MGHVSDHLKAQEMYEKAVEEDPWWLYTAPDHFKTKRMCEKAVEDEPYTLGYIPDHLKTEEICKEVVRREPNTLRWVHDHLKTQKICEEVIHVRPKYLFLISDRFKTQEMYIRAVKVDPWQLNDVPDWFVVLQKMWCEDFDDSHYLIRWHNVYKKCKDKKAQIKKELIPIAWHPSRWWDWCVPNNEKNWKCINMSLFVSDDQIQKIF